MVKKVSPQSRCIHGFYRFTVIPHSQSNKREGKVAPEVSVRIAIKWLILKMVTQVKQDNT